MAIDEVTRSVLRAREEVLTSPLAAHRAPGVRPQILDSWRRSLLYGVNPDRCEPQPTPSSAEASCLLRSTADIVVAGKSGALSQSNCSLAITDSEGRLLNRWVSDRGFAAMLDKHLILPDLSVAESATGTGSSSIVLETGQPVTVAGPEHFKGDWIGLTCAGAPIRHPITRRLLGSINLTVRYTETNSFLQSWVTSIAVEIEQTLLAEASTQEQVLLGAYLKANRDARHPVLCLNDRTVISNTPASRMLSPVDQVMLWEVASQLIGSPENDASVTLASGSSVSINVVPVSDGGQPIGAVIRLKSSEPISHQAPASPIAQSLPGLVGSSAAWQRMCTRAVLATNSPTLVTGEAGSGKLAVASAISGGSPTIVDAEIDGKSDAEWLTAVRDACESGATNIVLRHIDKLELSRARLTATLLESARERGTHVAATLTTEASEPAATPLLDWFDKVVEVPPLSHRIEDMALLLDNLTRRQVSGVRWLPDAVQTMIRIHWPRNVASLEEAVRLTLLTTNKPTIDAKDLPAEIRSRATRRTLVGLEQIEARAILEAMRDAGGNKRLAAESLGIARSTLYRKVRALGIDLSASNF